MRPGLVALLLLVPAASGVARAEPADAATWQRAVGLLQYLSSDYPAALRSGNPTEMAEQQGLASEAESAVADLGDAGLPFRARVAAVAARIGRGVDPEGVASDCRTLVDDLARAGGLQRSPRLTPDLAQGARLFQDACAICHAVNGSGDTPAAATLEPRPADLRSAERMDPYSPYRAFNILSLGIGGTAMPSFPTLSEQDRWDVAFHLLTLRQPECGHTPPRASLELLANATDGELGRRFGAGEVACLRRVLPRADEDQALAATRAGIDQALTLGAAGNFTGARQALLDTYLHSFEPIEPTVRARHPALVERFEEHLVRARVLAEQADPRFLTEAEALRSLVDDAARAKHGAPEAATVFWLALLIVLREGFEVVIVIAALLAVLKKMGQTHQARLVHAGWILALLAGALCFFFGRHLLAGANRELMEGVAGLLASGMLVYAALWLNAKTNLRRYMGELRERVQGAVGRGGGFGLFAIAFTALFRESFETAIFLQGLSIDSPSGVLLGAGVGVVVMTGLVLLIRKVGYVLPMKPLFTVSTWLLYGTAVVLLGQGLHALQETGLVPVRPMRGIRIDMLGIFPDAVTLLPQLAMALAPLFLWWWRRRGDPSGATTMKASGPGRA